jgi:pimeloyl-[acyl-carrier protein] methyl ester esterase
MSLAIYHDTYKCEGESSRGDIVLVHGWGMNSLVWDDLIPLLINHYQITVIDLPGMGRSPLPEGDYNLEFIVEKILELASIKATWIAWSLGALIVQKIALDYPERIEQGFLIAGTPKFVADGSWKWAMPLPIFEKFQALLEEDWQGTLIRFLTLQCKGSESIKEDTRKLREYLFHYGFPATKALREGLCILKDNDLRKRLKESVIPLHYILGEFDTLVPSAVEKELLSFSEKISVDVVKGASHVAQVSHPQQVAEIFFNYTSSGR